MILLAWSFGALRRRVDTQVFTNIYAKLATNVTISQKQLGVSHATILARTGLSKEFVNFFELHFPIFLTSLVSIVGSVVMLFFLKFM